MLTINSKDEHHLERGAFSTVYQTIWNNMPAAIKKPCDNPLAIKAFENEIAIHYRLTHSNIVDFWSATNLPSSRNLVMELMDGDLMRFISTTSGQINSKIQFSIAQNILRGLIYLHTDMQILHRDLKLENILFKRHNQTIIIKICDFGLSASIMDSDKFKDLAGTPEYIAPELYNSTSPYPYSIQSDIYAFALILWQLTSKCSLFLNAKEDLRRIRQLASHGELDNITKNTPIYLSKIILDCRSYYPAHRPRSLEIYEQLTEALAFPYELHHHELLHFARNTVNLTQEKKDQLLLLITHYPHILTWALDDQGNTFLHYVFATNHIQLIDKLVQLPQWNVLSQTKSLKTHWTLLHMSTAQGHRNLHTHLHAADVNAITIQGHSALILAASKGDAHACLSLIRLGADLNYQNLNGESALICASQCNAELTCKLLLKKGANPALKNKENKTAAELWPSTVDTNPFIVEEKTISQPLVNFGIFTLPETDRNILDSLKNNAHP